MGKHPAKPRQSMRQTAIDVMKANPDRPMGEVLPLIAAAVKRSIGEARKFYRWIVTHDRAPGVLQSGWRVFSSPYQNSSQLGGGHRNVA